MVYIPGAVERKEKFFSIIQSYSEANLGFDRSQYSPESDDLSINAVSLLIYHAIKRGEMYEDSTGHLWMTGYGPGATTIPVSTSVKQSPVVYTQPIGDWFMPGLQVLKDVPSELPAVFQKLPVNDITLTVQGMALTGFVFFSTRPEGESWQYIRESNFVLVNATSKCPENSYRIQNVVRLKFAHVIPGQQRPQITEVKVMDGYEVWVKVS